MKGEDLGRLLRMPPEEKTPLSLFLFFPSRLQKFVRLTPKQAYESLIYLLYENLGTRDVQSELGDIPSVKARLGGMIGVTVNLRIFAENGASTLDFSFRYRSLSSSILIVLIAAVGLSLIWGTSIPMLGLFLLLPLVFRASSAIRTFLNALNEVLPRLEMEYARLALMEERKRWQLEPKDVEALYRRLREKHIKTWGNTYALEYKIDEYKKLGLTREEAIRKIAEEEGIF